MAIYLGSNKVDDGSGGIGGVGISDVTVDQTSVVSGGVANIPYADLDTYGVITMYDDATYGLVFGTYDSTMDENVEWTVPILNSNNKIDGYLMEAATTTTNGAMSAADKTKVDALTSITTSEIDTIVAS